MQPEMDSGGQTMQQYNPLYYISTRHQNLGRVRATNSQDGGLH
jgi:hypothetical protein